MLVTHNAIAINPALYARLSYDTLRDFTQVTFLGFITFTLVIHPSARDWQMRAHRQGTRGKVTRRN